VVICVKTAEPFVTPFGLLARTGSRNHKLDEDPDHAVRRGNFGERAAVVKYRNFRPCTVQKRLNRSICHLSLWTRVGRRKHRFNRIRQVAPMCPHKKAHWRHLVNASVTKQYNLVPAKRL